MILLSLLLLAGCASIPKDYTRTSSTATQDYQSTSVGKLFERSAARHPGKSGFDIVRYGNQAFTARIALTELAEKSLDVQVYIWEADETGRILAERFIKAADRGVKVRLLVDDINLAGRDAVVASMDAHPNIEIRIFNPFANRKFRALDFISDLNRVNHRMHNKTMLMDNAVAIIGGRNIGNHHFGVATDANFRDLDIAAAGPVVREISNVFDHFWNGNWSVPIAALVDRDFTHSDLLAARENLRRQIDSGNYPYPLDEDVSELRSRLLSIRDEFIWAPGKIVWNDPADIKAGEKHGNMIKALHRKLHSTHQELLIESAYFVPRNKGIAQLKSVHERGAYIRVLTNSMASNDVLAAHAGYAKYRQQLLESGVQLYEIRPDAGLTSKNPDGNTATAALHTKALVFDRESIFIGSFNLAPRSANINTEAGLYVESPALAKRVIAYMDEGVKPENSYRVALDEEGELVWITLTDGEEVRYKKDPETGAWKRFMAGFIQILPFEKQL